MKVFAYIGSNKGKNSKTKKLCDVFIEILKDKIDEEIQYSVYTGNQLKISQCSGCTGCFNTGKCPLSEDDQIDIVKEELMKADVIIFGSPSYAHSVSGNMKNLIDRLIYGAHYLTLAGSFGIVLATCCNSGGMQVGNYLIKIQRFLGIDTVGAILRQDELPEDAIDFDEQKYMEGIVEKLLERYNNVTSDDIKMSEMQENYFNTLNNKFFKMKEYGIKDYESERWEDYCKGEVRSFKELFKKKFLERKYSKKTYKF